MKTSILGMNLYTVKCQKCGKDAVVTPLNWTTLEYGFILLAGQEDGYIGITCPDRECLHTTVVKESMEKLRSLRTDLLAEAEYGPGYVKPLLRYRSFPYVFGYPPELQEHRLDAIYRSSSDGPQVAIEAESYPILKDNGMKDFSGFYWPYFWDDLAMGPNVYIPFLRGDGIEEIVKYENDTKTRVLPRYMPYDKAIEDLDSFTHNHLFMEMERETIQRIFDGASQISIVDQYNNIRSLKAADRSHQFLEILTTPIDQTRRNMERMRATLEEEDDEDQPALTATEKSLEDEVARYFNKGFGKSFLEKRYLEFIEKYLAISNKQGFSAQAVETLRKEYLDLLHGQLKSDMLETKQYAFYEEARTWTIIFDYEPIRLLEGHGFKYIHHLVSNPRQQLTIFDLAKLTNEREVIHVQPEDEDAEEFKGDQKHAGEEDDEDSEDKRYLHRLKVRLATIDEEILGAARYSGPDLDKEKLESERDDIQQEINKVTYRIRFGKDPDSENSENTRLMKRIAKRIERAVKDVKRACPKAGAHFESALKPISSFYQRYNPVEDIHWHLG